MNKIGLDFGGSQLQAAIELEGTPIVVAHKDMNLIVRCNSPDKNEIVERYEVVSLKRILDFDNALLVSNSGTNSLDYLAETFHDIGAECQQHIDKQFADYVIAVPPCFSQRQRSAIKTTTQKTLFHRIKLVDDTQAALLASKDCIRDNNTVLVYSWGASTFSTSLYERTKKGYRVLINEGTMDLGGDNLDTIILRRILYEMNKIAPKLLAADLQGVLLRTALEARRIKLMLTKQQNGYVRLSNIFCDNTQKHLQQQTISIPFALYQRELSNMIEDTLGFVEKVLSAKEAKDPDVILLSGKMSQLPQTHEALKNFLHVSLACAKETAVAIGAVLYGKGLPETEWEKAELKHSKRKPPDDIPSSPQVAVEKSEPVTGEQRKKHKDGWVANFIPLLDEAEQNYERKHFRQAVNTFEKLLYQMTRFSGELYRTAAKEQERAGNPEEALKILKKAIQQDSTNSFVAVDFAKLCYKQCKLSRSRMLKKTKATTELIDQAIHAIELLPDGGKTYAEFLAQLLHFKACILCDKNSKEYLMEAKKLVSRSLRLHPGQEVYEQDLKRILVALKKPSKFTKLLRPKSGKGTLRNQPCRCGSGKKYKKCCGAPKLS